MLKSKSDRVLFLIFALISILSYGSILAGNLINIVILGANWGDCTQYFYEWECSNTYFAQITEWLRSFAAIFLIDRVILFLVFWIIIVGFTQGVCILLPFLFARKVQAWIGRGA